MERLHQILSTGGDNHRHSISFQVVLKGMDMLMPTPFPFALMLLVCVLGWYALRKDYDLKLTIRGWFIFEARVRRVGAIKPRVRSRSDRLGL